MPPGSRQGLAHQAPQERTLAFMALTNPQYVDFQGH